MIRLTSSIALASKAKGPFAFVRRARSIAGRYGLTSALMDRALKKFYELLKQNNCSATIPITAVTLQRHGKLIKKYLGQNFEFAVHGYAHVDYAQFAPEAQLAHLQHAREVFRRAGIVPAGFRSPYLRREPRLYEAIGATGFSYVSNQPFLWDVLDPQSCTPSMKDGYERALVFYKPWLAGERVSLPRRHGQLIEIPVSLPDDEMLIERLGAENGLVTKTWLSILTQAYRREELFTLQLHPERIALCANGLSAVLTKARSLTPSVWCARLSEIANWWKARARAVVDITDAGDGCFRMRVSAPSETIIIARSVEIDVPSAPWAGGSQQIIAREFTVRTPTRPFIGLSPGTSPALASFLHEQGYLLEIDENRNEYPFYIDQPEFIPEQEHSLVTQIDEASFPLVRLGRWPNGARCALAITGDIDALSLWDYGLRMIGK